MKEVLLEKKPRISYKARIRCLNLQSMIPRSLIPRHLYHAYEHNFDAVSVILLGIGGINVLIVLQINFLYIFVIVGRKLRHKIKIEDAFGRKVASGW
jgi:hypothetical protein